MEKGLPFDLFSFMNWKYSYLLTYAVLIVIISLISILPFYFWERHRAKTTDPQFEIIMNVLKEEF